jgi:hypothetical protein
MKLAPSVEPTSNTPTTLGWLTCAIAARRRSPNLNATVDVDLDGRRRTERTEPSRAGLASAENPNDEVNGGVQVQVHVKVNVFGDTTSQGQLGRRARAGKCYTARA